MLHLLELAGWPSLLLLAASILGLAIILERGYALRTARVLPPGLLERVMNRVQQQALDPEWLRELGAGSALGRVFAAGVRNSHQSRETMKEAIEEAGRAVLVDLERSLTTLGTISIISPLLGLFGTVIGMIMIFGQGEGVVSRPVELAQGISYALYNTALGLIVAVPATIFYRRFRSHVDRLVVEMEQQAIKLVEILQGERRV